MGEKARWHSGAAEKEGAAAPPAPRGALRPAAAAGLPQSDRRERRSGERREGLTQSEGVRVPGEGVEGGTADWCRGDQLLQTQVAGTEERTVKGTILFVVGSAKKQKYKN